MVVQRTLTPPVGVRSSHPQPHRSSAAAAVFSFRGVAQLVARLVRDQEAVGSNPVTPTKKPFVPCPGTNGFFVLECREFEQPDPAAAGRKSARWAVCEGAGALLFTHRIALTEDSNLGVCTKSEFIQRWIRFLIDNCYNTLFPSA